MGVLVDGGEKGALGTILHLWMGLVQDSAHDHLVRELREEGRWAGMTGWPTSAEALVQAAQAAAVDEQRDISVECAMFGAQAVEAGSAALPSADYEADGEDPLVSLLDRLGPGGSHR